MNRGKFCIEISRVMFLVLFTGSVILASQALGVTVKPPKLPDLSIKNQSYSPDTPIINQPVTISFEVWNNGDLPCGFSSVEIKCDAPAITTTYEVVPPLYPNEFYYVEHEVTFTEGGTYQFDITADIYNEVEESNEHNNGKKLNVTVYDPGVDLIIDSLTHEPEDPNTSDTVIITAVVKNIGEQTCTTPTVLLVSVTNSIDKTTTVTVPSLGPGATFEFQVDLGEIPLDCYSVVAVADADDEVMERFEDNNTANDEFCVKSWGPDLVVSDITHAPPEPWDTDPQTTVTVTVKNIGNTAVTTTTTLAVGINGDYTYYDIPPLGPGAEFSVKRQIDDPDPGNYSVYACADNDYEQPETREDNNCTDYDFTVLEALPDLVVDTLTHVPDKPTDVEEITITAVVKNIGLVPAGESVLALSVGDEDPPKMYAVPELAPGETFNVVRKLVIPAPGVYVITAIVDYDEEVEELREKKFNIFLDAVEVFEAPKPDLVIDTLDHDPADPTTDDDVTITAIVKNIGEIPSGESDLVLVVDGTPTSYTVPALDPDETFQVQKDVNFPDPGSYEVQAMADAGFEVVEQDEDNNTAEDTIEVTAAPRPDLIIDLLDHDPDSPTTWDVVTITAIVKNVGNLAATTSTLELKIDDEALPSEFEIPTLAPGETFQVQRQETFADPGTYEVTATADIEDVVEESDETNNTGTDSIEVTLPEVPDLAVISLTHDPADPIITDTITITAVVKNIGNAEATTSTLSIEVEGEATPALFEIPILPIGAEFEVERDVIIGTPGTYQVTAIADAPEEIIELDEENNVLTDEIHVRGIGPDLIVESLTLDPASPTTWDDITFTAVVKNDGTTSAGASKLELKVGGETTPPTYDVPALEPGETFEVERTLNLPVAQSYSATATADIENVVEEYNEDNNVTTKMFTVTEPLVPDLIISSLIYAPLTAIVNETVTITAEVKNDGNADITTTTTLWILVGDELDPASYDIPPLAIGETFSVNRDVIFTSTGSYMVTATADPEDEIVELHEDNNAATIEIIVYETLVDKIKDYLLGKITLTPEEMELYDLNDDGVIDIADLIKLILV